MMLIGGVLVGCGLLLIGAAVALLGSLRRRYPVSRERRAAAFRALIGGGAR